MYYSLWITNQKTVCSHVTCFFFQNGGIMKSRRSQDCANNQIGFVTFWNKWNNLRDLHLGNRLPLQKKKTDSTLFSSGKKSNPKAFTVLLTVFSSILNAYLFVWEYSWDLESSRNQLRVVEIQWKSREYMNPVWIRRGFYQMVINQFLRFNIPIHELAI